MTETMSVDVTLRSLQAVPGRGRLAGVAAVTIALDGVEIVVQGLRMLRRADGRVELARPVYRDPRSGRLLPSVILPEEVERAIGELIGQEMAAR